ncbi:Hypothetical predicted protein [Mytilus galloprovincialis]|uniref:SUEL-type lectin domain-containing protein n=1 Tax=Mytilus galloprovincialis TaxID=29158 RepID=A0A8B6HBG4_MYTGA|nr:Hypothetical predicted protein [Mytilus galloprovincialis]
MLLNILKFLVFASIFINFTSAQTNKGITICEGKTSYISCSNNKAITIVRALFGRNKKNRECRIFSFFKSCSVFGNHTLRLVKDMCEGQQSCQLTASRNIFGDPCKYLKKYLEVVYKCVERQNLVPVMTTSTGNMDITIEDRDGIKDTTISIWILIFAIAGSLILSQFILVVCVVKLIKRKKKPTNKKDGVCKHLKREQLAVRKIQSEYQSEISTVSNHMYDALEPDEHSYISVI